MGVAPHSRKRNKRQDEDLEAFLERDDNGESDASFCLGSSDGEVESDDQNVASRVNHYLRNFSEDDESRSSSGHDSLAEELHEDHKNKCIRRKRQGRKRAKDKPLKKRLRRAVKIDQHLNTLLPDDAEPGVLVDGNVEQARSSTILSLISGSYRQEHDGNHPEGSSAAELYLEDDEEVKPKDLHSMLHNDVPDLSTGLGEHVEAKVALVKQAIKVEECDVKKEKHNIKKEKTAEKMVIELD